MINNLEAVNEAIVVIGGGTGSFTVLRGLKQITSNLTALVSMVDDGGSTGQLRDEYGVLPPGDVRQCLVALSNSSQEMRELFNYRFGEGSLEGHSFGNIFLAAVEKMTNNFDDATRLAGEVLNITGRVVPITTDNAQLVLHDGHEEIVGQHTIDNSVLHKHAAPELTLRPQAGINPMARDAILGADVVVLAPGSLYGSLIASLIVDGVKDALQQTKATVVQVVNLVTKPGQTDGWSVVDYVREFERFIGQDTIDIALYNTQKPSEHMLAQYVHDREYPVRIDQPLQYRNCRFVGADLLALDAPVIPAHDKLRHERTLMRHDPALLAQAITRL